MPRLAVTDLRRVPDCWHSPAGFMLATGKGRTELREPNGYTLLTLVNDPDHGYFLLTDLPVRHPHHA